MKVLEKSSWILLHILFESMVIFKGHSQIGLAFRILFVQESIYLDTGITKTVNFTLLLCLL